MERMAATVTLGAILGAFAGCLPAAALIAGHNIFPRPAPMGIGIAVYIFLIVFTPLGMVAGAIGGVMYGTKPRFLTAASLCLGIVVGAIVASFAYAIAEHFIYLVGLAPTVGGVLGLFYAIWTWRRLPR